MVRLGEEQEIRDIANNMDEHYVTERGSRSEKTTMCLLEPVVMEMAKHVKPISSLCAFARHPEKKNSNAKALTFRYDCFFLLFMLNV